MATFNSMPAMSAAAPNEAMGLNHPAPGHPMTMGHFDQDFGFDEAVLEPAPLPNIPFTPAYDFDHLVSAFEDPFAYSHRAFEPAPNADAFNEASSPQELDNKLLGFSDPIMSATVVDENGKFADVNMSAELYGMFFVAEDVFGRDNSGRPLELTCYRRNLWQCSGQITLPKNLSHLMDEQGRQFSIDELSASITAVESIEGKSTEIISIPWKSSNLQAPEEPKIAAAPPQIPLDLSTAQEVDAVRVTLPVSWKRLQFKHATANNGRRKGLQQHYVVQINLVAKSKSSDMMKIAEIQSGPVIVRGRSPRNFDSRKDVPLTGEKRTERKNTASSDDAALKVERESTQVSMQRFQCLGSVATPVEWAANHQPVPHPSNQSPHPTKKMAVSPTAARPPVPSWSADGKTVAAGHAPRGSMSRQNTAVPINLSLSEDEKSPNRSSAELQSPQMGKAHTVSGQNAGNSPADDPDPLYEYFPLTLDDWMPPIDAVYRPHVVHHTIVPPEIKAQQSQTKAKRYFAAE
ncbi:acid phosphatase (PhoG) [Metarhizium album ARSEF 1941]|uniref:Acid phosphatase (PhoG) n=1 Tax=Metarhizium album (strain ARSEF 1941) TaxID=1081103 RepID=A0A0B2X7Q3_METAS|nr:acid phosphatase (PhoG) [Metarhizium album ARSEF 1941]KHO01758.1 acid phosphatase (PhoG) [Metarhizium album ARSEF 1941]